MNPQGEALPDSRHEEQAAEGEEHGEWWADRLVILRPEAADRDWGRLHVVPAQEEDLANRVLADVLTGLRDS